MTESASYDVQVRSTDVIPQQEMAMHVNQCLGLSHYTLIIQNA